MSELPASVASSTLNIMGVDIVVHVLDDGQRIIEAEGMHRFLEMLGSDAKITEDDAMKFAKLIKGQAQ